MSPEMTAERLARRGIRALRARQENKGKTVQP
jgi:hypothetical protein